MLRARIARACERVERNPSEVCLIGAAKTVIARRLQPFIAAGLADVGENYVQEGVAKRAKIHDPVRWDAEWHVRWHLIGALQRNKARQAVGAFALIHSVDRPSLAQALDHAAENAGLVQDVLLQVNLGGEASKSGCAPHDLENLARQCVALTHLRVGGLMCLPPYEADAERTRPYFRELREMRDGLAAQNLLPENAQLSMGMSDDFEVAIEEGATMVRIGTALFGPRRKTP